MNILCHCWHMCPSLTSGLRDPPFVMAAGEGWRSGSGLYRIGKGLRCNYGPLENCSDSPHYISMWVCETRPIGSSFFLLSVGTIAFVPAGTWDGKLVYVMGEGHTYTCPDTYWTDHVVAGKKIGMTERFRHHFQSCVQSPKKFYTLKNPVLMCVLVNKTQNLKAYQRIL